MTDSRFQPSGSGPTDDELKSFLQRYQPRPEHDRDASQLSRIRARLNTARAERRLFPMRWPMRWPMHWLAASSALAAGCLALIMTTQANRMEHTHPHSTPVPISLEREGEDLYSEDLPAHDIGESYFDLVAAAAKP